MLTVDQYELIRRKHFHEGMSVRAIARTLGHSRRTVAKAIAHPIPPGYRLSQPRPKPVLDAFRPIIDAWLEEDQRRPRKQRHTAQRIFERLRDEHGFTGSYTTVRRYVQTAAARQQEVFMPLAFEPAEEAQVDGHEGWVIENGQEQKRQFFCMRLCFSKASFVRAYRRATLESFLDGHVRAFEHFGGIPKRLAYDNLKSAVTHVQRGKERRLNPKFKELRCWYLFDTRFCGVGRGNEKGDVENLAKRSERRYLTPVPACADLTDLNQHLLAECQKDLDLAAPRPHGDRTRSASCEEEKPLLHPLPEPPFPACQQSSTFVSARSLVQADTNQYSVPVQWAHHPALVRQFVDRVEIHCGQERVAVHNRCYERGQFVLDPLHYLRLLERKPGTLDNARAFKGQPWGDDFAFMRAELEYRYGDEGTRRFIDILLLFTEHEEEAVKQAVQRCVRRRAFSYEAVLGVLRDEPVSPSVRLDLSDRPILARVGSGIRPASIYDQLVREEVMA